MIVTKELTKTFVMGDTEIQALDNVNLNIGAGEYVSIMGPSGSGKSTLMSIIGCLDIPTTGSYYLDGIAVEKMTDHELAEIRGKKIGFVFQQFNLLARTSALENVMLPMTYAGVSEKVMKEKAVQALETVGLASRMKHHPNELSGGQMQRVAIARALVNDPAIILADEPTGALDSKTGADILALFQNLYQSLHQTVILVTHDINVARHTQRIIRIADGKIISDEKNEPEKLTGDINPELSKKVL
jgi:putative ABC transport system ATP-binding protein